MSQNILTLDISPADWTDIDAALLVLETKFAPKLIDLTIEQRSELTKMGNKSEAFCRQSLITGRQKVDALTTQAATDLTAAEGDLTGVDQIRPRLARLVSLCEKAADSELALGSDVMVYCLYLYGLLKAIGAGDGLDALRSQMKARFPGRPKKQTPTA